MHDHKGNIRETARTTHMPSCCQMLAWPYLPSFQVCCLLVPNLLLLQDVPQILSLMAAAAAQQHTYGLWLTAARRLLRWPCCAFLLCRCCAGYNER
jgi:hypothetical protein